MRGSKAEADRCPEEVQKGDGKEMRDRRYDWALGATNAALKQAQENIEEGDRINTLVSGYSKAERQSIDPAACWSCDGHGCIECNGTGYAEWVRKRRRA